MNIKIVGQGKDADKLFDYVSKSLEDLGLDNFINLVKINDDKIKQKINIKKEPALVLEEENIDFSDVIFEGFIPSEEEIKSMLISIIGLGDNNSCSGNCSGCSC